MLDEAKPYMDEKIKAGIAQAILDAKKRKGEYVAEATPIPQMASAGAITGAVCNHRQEDYETGVAAYCGKMSGHKLGHGAWIRGEELDA